MTISGGCYCGALRYKADGDPVMKAVCHCRECQHIAGGGANFIMGMRATDFAYTQGEPSQFTRSDLDAPASREFCGKCGTHILTRSPRVKGVVLIKAGSLDDQTVFDMPQMSVYMSEKQPYHLVPEGVPCFETFPGR